MMEALQLFLLHYDDLHAEDERSPFHGLTDDQIRFRPHPAVNSVAWLIWHMARCEDNGLNRLVALRPQVFDEEDWPQRLQVTRRDLTTGMTNEEVSAFSAAVDIEALRAYWQAVGDRTRTVVRALQPGELDDVLYPAYVHRVCTAEGVLGPHAGWVEAYWRGKTKGWHLANLGLIHNYEHYGQAALVRGLLGYQSL
jgi:hypothetical protein